MTISLFKIYAPNAYDAVLTDLDVLTMPRAPATPGAARSRGRGRGRPAAPGRLTMSRASERRSHGGSNAARPCRSTRS